MAECCVEREQRERAWRGDSIRWAIRRCLPRNDYSPEYVAYWLDYSRRQAADTGNPPDERRAWRELAEELEGLT